MTTLTLLQKKEPIEIKRKLRKKRDPQLAKDYAAKRQRAVETDRELGRRVRLLRLEKKLSQAELAKAVGVSFQQIQKYEKGGNRIGVARLTQIANFLNVPISHFYEMLSTSTAEVQTLLTADSGFSLRFLRAYTDLKDRELQRCFVALLERMVELRSQPSDH